MKKTMVLVLTTMWLLVVPIRADQHVAVIKNLADKADIKRNSEVIAASKGLTLMNQDIVQTQTQGYVGITFIDGTSITIGPNSEFKIDRYVFEPNEEVFAFAVYLKKGSALFNTGKIGKLSPDSVQLSTPRATVGIRGTRFIVEVQ